MSGAFVINLQYPDSGKFGAVGGRQPGAALTAATCAGNFVPESTGVDYWDGE